MPAKSKKQFGFMKAVEHGMKPKGSNITKTQAAEYTKGQKSAKGLPMRARKGKR